MFVREGQTTPIHFHWHKMEDIINRGGGDLCMNCGAPTYKEGMTDACSFQNDWDHHDRMRRRGAALARQSITFEPYMYHTFC